MPCASVGVGGEEGGDGVRVFGACEGLSFVRRERTDPVEMSLCSGTAASMLVAVHARGVPRRQTKLAEIRLCASVHYNRVQAVPVRVLLCTTTIIAGGISNYLVGRSVVRVQ